MNIGDLVIPIFINDGVYLHRSSPDGGKPSPADISNQEAADYFHKKLSSAMAVPMAMLGFSVNDGCLWMKGETGTVITVDGYWLEILAPAGNTGWIGAWNTTVVQSRPSSD